MLAGTFLTLCLSIAVYALAEGHAVSRATAGGACSRCGSAPLHDDLHAMLPDWAGYVQWRDVLLLGTAAAAAASVLVAGGVGRLLELATDVADNMSWLLTVKAFTSGLTAIPSSHPSCSAAAGAPRGHCSHNMFSGHNAAAMVLLQAHLARGGLPAMRVPMCGLLLLNACATLCTRAHYTADIVVAWALASKIRSSTW